MEKKSGKCIKSKHRTEAEKKSLIRRLRIIGGQVNGIQQMIEEDRYCDDVLLQIASAANALKSLGNEVIKGHIKSCMMEDIAKGDLEVVDEVMDLFVKFK